MDIRKVVHRPGFQSILRLQRTVGNRLAQQILGIGDGESQPAPPEEIPRPVRWVLILALAALGSLLCAGAASAAGAPPRWSMATAAAGALIAFAAGWAHQRSWF